MLVSQLKMHWKNIFYDNDEYIEWYFKHIFDKKNTELEINSEKIDGMIYQNKYDMCSGKNVFNARYLVGISVLPEKTGKGILSKMLKNIFVESYKNKEEFIYLTPIDKNIYENFGFTYVSTLSKYKIQFSALKNFKNETNVISYQKKDINDKIIEELVEFYNKIAEKYFIKVIKKKKDFENTVSEFFLDNGSIYISYDEKNKINGYMFLNRENKIMAKEIFFSDVKALKSFLNIISVHKNYFDHAEITLAENIYLEDILQNEKDIIKTIKNKSQIRIVNVEKSFLKISERLEKNEKIYIKITDKYIFENNGVYEITSSNITKFETTDINLKSNYIELGIDELATLVYGFRDFNSFSSLKNEKIDDKNLIFNRIFTKKINYINQDF